MRKLLIAAMFGLWTVGLAWFALRPRVAEGEPEAEQLDLEALEALTRDPVEGRMEFTEAGLSLETSPELKLVKVDAGVNRIVRVLRAGRPLLIANSAPVYPWMDLEGVRRTQNGGWEKWSSGPVEVPGLAVKIDWPGSWAYEAGSERRLVLVAEGRAIAISGPSWEDPTFLRLLGSLRSAKGGDYRSVYVRIGRAPADSAGKEPSEQLRADLDRALALVEGSEANPAPALAQGAAAWRARKMDTLDAMIFADLLFPYLRDIERAEFFKHGQEQQAGCPYMAPSAETAPITTPTGGQPARDE